MWTKGFALLGLAFGAAIMGSACVAGEPTDDERDAGLPLTAAEEEDLGAAEDDLSIQDFARLPRCGGFAGFRCPAGLRCIDLPGDDCDPARGGADCIGVCVRGGPTAARCANPRRTYISRDPAQCAAMLFRCEPGFRPFSDECGCGCLRVGGPGGGPGRVRCRENICGPGEYCCNESCGICAPIGGFCTQEFCQ
ncbi:hypothetical protein [Polyangium jinanense]|uniref:Uncharacterized protein n=1 Tax=Polyangium jinanense TaxID=2829994 RepID=A0A9X3XCB2_9BACT|nr:hypothetical protein [Polyangium jinanense]MDC3961343.1 hypothetical protein [Polyangium jinanense]MDC3987722.1 hypothetical protein [Polyangium jinanense]